MFQNLSTTRSAIYGLVASLTLAPIAHAQQQQHRSQQTSQHQSHQHTHQQSQQIFPVIDLNLSPQWEVNFGVGVDVSNASDHLIVKGIIGRRFSWRKGHKDPTQ